MDSPLGASRIAEQPRCGASSTRYVHDPMTQGYRPRAVVDHRAQCPRLRFQAQGRSLLYPLESRS